MSGREDEPIELDRTWLCVVVFMDMVKYSRQSQEVQAQWRDRFKQYLSEAIKDAAETERVIIDCGDGAAIVFLGDPELPMLCALRVLGAIALEKGPLLTPMKARIGINLGSVRLVRDINGNIAAAGDGINVGQRVMSFARDNQILVSRSFHEVASLLADKYAPLFRYEGVRNDKHGRPHTLYELQLPGASQSISANPPAVREESSLGPEQLAALELSLAHILGPIAKHLLKSARERTGSASELCYALLALIPAETDREVFLAAWKKIFPAASAPPEKSPASSPASATPPLDPSILERVRKNLASYIGPMALVLVKRAAKRAPTESALYEILAAEIPSAEDRESFLKSPSRL